MHTTLYANYSKSKDTGPLVSLIAGGVAGGIEATLTVSIRVSWL